MRPAILLAVLLALAIPGEPRAAASPEAAAITVTVAGAPLAPVPLASLRTLATASADRDAHHFAGPTLWAVLGQSGAIDPGVRGRGRRTILVTGKDGYSAALAMGEVDPEFEGKPVLLALDQDGAALDTPRLIVPGDKRAGRSVRDVAGIEIR